MMRLADSSPGGVSTEAAVYWEERARRFALEGEGLPAICSYGMPAFYNRAIHLAQSLALRPWLRAVCGEQVLDVGCGVGRWSRRMAAEGAEVTGIDLSPTMVAEAGRRAAREGLAQRCRFMVQDLANLDLGRPYRLILGVTVLQHIVNQDRLGAAVRRLAGHLACGGRIVLLEAAPTEPASHCDGAYFKARSLESYLALFRNCGLRVTAVTGVDPMPLRRLFLPHYARMSKPLLMFVAGAASVLSFPVDAAFGRRWVKASWHKVFVMERVSGQGKVLK